MNFQEISRKENSDLHVHTRYSKDSFLCPRKIVAFANKHKKIMAITDHNEIAGALEAKKYDRKNRIIIGEEIKTTDLEIEILAYNIQKKIAPGKARDIISAIHSQGGVAVLAHPYRCGYIFKKELKPVPVEIIKLADGIEVENARCSQAENQKALELAKKYQKLETRGSDAHMAWELQSFRYNNLFLNLLKNLLTVFIKRMKKFC